jgi:NAD(P)-dependent dehydrogenase (short-subunit alcohol dehydrogenase family)
VKTKNKNLNKWIILTKKQKTILRNGWCEFLLLLQELKGVILDTINARTPLGRPGEAEEMSFMAAFLSLLAASYITG